jgi:hypothetical protein
MDNYTKGPWIVTHGGHVADSDGRPLFFAQSSGQEVSPKDRHKLTPWARPDEEVAANAHIASAAPCLLDALGALLVAISLNGIDPKYQYAIKKAREAIKKAEGESND